jgi:hypothetical protein
MIPKAEAYLRIIDDNHRRKAVQIHQDWEDRYMQPFHGRMQRKMNGRPYSEFHSNRTRTLSELETQSGGPPSGLGSGPLYNALEDEDSVNVPYVKIPTDGLDDRIHKYLQHTKTEDRLSRLVNESHGISVEEPQITERNTVDVKGWTVLPDTRLYVEDEIQAVKKGRRPFSEILHSKIDEAMGHF